MCTCLYSYTHIWLWADIIWAILCLLLHLHPHPQCFFRLRPWLVEMRRLRVMEVSPIFSRNKIPWKSPKSGDFWLQRKSEFLKCIGWDSKILILILGWNIYIYIYINIHICKSSWWVLIFMFTSIWGRFPFWLLFWPPTRYFLDFIDYIGRRLEYFNEDPVSESQNMGANHLELGKLNAKKDGAADGRGICIQHNQYKYVFDLFWCCFINVYYIYI